MWPHQWPSWVLTIDAMIEEGADIQANCDTCSLCRPVDLEAIRAAKGGDYSLINRRTRCKEPGCRGWVRFQFRLGVMRRLWDDETSVNWMCG